MKKVLSSIVASTILVGTAAFAQDFSARVDAGKWSLLGTTAVLTPSANSVLNDATKVDLVWSYSATDGWKAYSPDSTISSNIPASLQMSSTIPTETGFWVKWKGSASGGTTAVSYAVPPTNTELYMPLCSWNVIAGITVNGTGGTVTTNMYTDVVNMASSQFSYTTGGNDGGNGPFWNTVTYKSSDSSFDMTRTDGSSWNIGFTAGANNSYVLSRATILTPPTSGMQTNWESQAGNWGFISNYGVSNIASFTNFISVAANSGNYITGYEDGGSHYLVGRTNYTSGATSGNMVGYGVSASIANVGSWILSGTSADQILSVAFNNGGFTQYKFVGGVLYQRWGDSTGGEKVGVKLYPTKAAAITAYQGGCQ